MRATEAQIRAWIARRLVLPVGQTGSGQWAGGSWAMELAFTETAPDGSRSPDVGRLWAVSIIVYGLPAWWSNFTAGQKDFELCDERGFYRWWEVDRGWRFARSVQSRHTGLTRAGLVMRVDSVYLAASRWTEGRAATIGAALADGAEAGLQARADSLTAQAQAMQAGRPRRIEYEGRAAALGELVATGAALRALSVPVPDPVPEEPQ